MQVSVTTNVILHYLESDGVRYVKYGSISRHRAVAQMLFGGNKAQRSEPFRQATCGLRPLYSPSVIGACCDAVRLQFEDVGE